MYNLTWFKDGNGQVLTLLALGFKHTLNAMIYQKKLRVKGNFFIIFVSTCMSSLV